MKAIVKTRPEFGVEVRDVEKPVVGENDILIRILAGSVCGSDVHIYEWTAGYEWMQFPVIPGHEFAGEVVEIGDRISSVSIGDRITAVPSMPCSECEACRTGRVDECKDRYNIGMRKNGAFAEYMLIKGSAEILKIPDNVSIETASMTEPLVVALHGIDLSGFRAGQTAAVFGPGPIGLLTIQLLKAAGASLIIATGTDADSRRLEIAKQLGADVVINVNEEDPVKSIRKMFGFLDYVFEATGVPQTISQGLQIIKRGGKVMVAGIHEGEASFNPLDLVRRQKSLIGVYNYTKTTWQRALALMAGNRIDINPIITHRIPFSRGVEGFELALNKTAAKVIFVPESE